MTDLIETVAARVGRTPADIRQVLDEHGVQLYSPRSQADRIVLKKLRFSGFKDPDQTTPRQPFDFEWDLDPELNVLGSQNNSAGKTSVLEICRWMLTGRDRHSSGGLDPRVRAMLRRIELTFTVGSDEVVIEVDASSPNLPGSMMLLGSRSSFDAETMSQVVGQLMLDRLRLPAMSRFTRTGGTTRGAVVEQTWPLYSGALIVGPTHLGAVLGTVEMEAGSLLQMYVAVPWFETLLQARAARDQLTQDLRDRQKAAEAEQASRIAETELIEQELEAADAELQKLPSAGDLLDELSRGVVKAGEVNRTLIALQEQLAATEAAARVTEAIRNEAHLELVALQEHTQASAYFRALQPAACPRCDQPIDQTRLETEQSDHSCSVCTRTNEPLVDPTALPRAEAAASETDRQFKAAVARVKQLKEQVQEANQQQDQVRGAGEVLSTRNDVAERQVRVVQAERLRGRLQERSEAAVRANALPEQDPDYRVLEAAVDVANILVRENAAGLFEDLNERLVILGQRFGIVELSRTALDRAAHLPVWKGTTRYNFRQLSEGDRLRLKVALVIALLETAAARGLGHHPGLLLIDSPGAQEVGHAPLAEMLSALNTAAGDLHVQVIVATARLQEAIDVLGDGRVRQPVRPDSTLW